jgi:simple sugar transport system permease protein
MAQPQVNAIRPTLVLRAKSMVPPSLVDATVISIAALCLSLTLFGLFVLCSDINPFEMYQLMFRGAFGTPYSWRSTMIHSAPIMLTALCVVMPARVGLIIIGGEGCVVLGGLMATLTAHLLPNSSPMVVLIAMIIVGSAAGGIWVAAIGALRLFRGVNETISSLLLNYIALAILNHCVEGPMHDPTFHDKVASYSIGVANTLGNIPGTEIHYGFLYGIILCIICGILMDHTTFGFAAKIVGGNIRAARISGLSVAKYSLAACFIGGSAAALAGVVEVAAVQGRANSDLSCGYGYAGILVAFVARQNPFAVIPVALLLGGVASSGDLLQAQLGLSSASVQVFQGILFLCILGLDTWAGRLGELKSMKFLRPFSGGIRRITNRSSPKGVAHGST